MKKKRFMRRASLMMAALLLAQLCAACAVAEDAPPVLDTVPDNVEVMTPAPTEVPTPPPVTAPPVTAPPVTAPPADDLVLPIGAKMSSSAGSITITVTASGRPVIVRLLQADAEVVRQRLESGSGTVSFTALKPGTYSVVIDYEGDTEGLHAVTIAGINVTAPTAVPIVATAVGGVGSVSVSVTNASAIPVAVTLLRDGQAVITQTIAAGVGNVSFGGLVAGTYSVKLDYQPAQSGVNPTVIDQIIVTSQAVPISIQQVIGGENKLTISGSAQPNTEIVLTTEPASLSAVAHVDAAGQFTAELICAAGTYTVVYAQYGTDVTTRVMTSGLFVVTVSPNLPLLEADPISTLSSTVYAKTIPGTLVNLGTLDYGQTVIADERGILCFSLPHLYEKETIVTFTVFYGDNNAHSYQQIVMVGDPIVYPLLTRGDTGAYVYTLTERLAELDYLSGAQKGYDSDVVTAVRVFQSFNDLTVDGKAGQQTQEALFSVRAYAYWESERYPTLVRGDSGLPLIEKLQERLKALGYYNVRADGVFDSATQQAVREFQEHNGLNVTGKADHATQRLLYSSSARPAPVTPTATPTATQTPNTTASILSYRTLYRSNRFDASVVTLQRRLVQLGYLTGSMDGHYGSATYRAVREFQRLNALPVSGVADGQTQNLLYSADALSTLGVAAGVSVSVTPSVAQSVRELSWGDEGEDVWKLQIALLEAGYNQVRTADGIYGQWTYDAVSAFQRDHGLTVNGVAGRDTQNALFGTDY